MKLFPLCIAALLVLGACKSDEEKAKASGDAIREENKQRSESVWRYIGCKAKGGHDRYDVVMVHVISWMEDITPRIRYRLDLVDKDWNVRSYDSLRYPSLEDGRLSFSFAGGNDRVEIRHAAASYGFTEVTFNEEAPVTIQCLAHEEENFISPSEKARRFAADISSTPWCQRLGEEKVDQFQFGADGSLTVHTCSHVSNTLPSHVFSSRSGSWSRDRSGKFHISLDGIVTRWDRVIFWKKWEGQGFDHIRLFRDGESSGMSYDACGPCWQD
jgi:hypothetical protein